MTHQRERFAQNLFLFVAIFVISACTPTRDRTGVTEAQGDARTATVTHPITTATITPSKSLANPLPAEEEVWVLPTTAFMTPVPEFEIDLEGPCLTGHHAAVELPNPDDLQWGLRQEQMLELTGLTTEIHTTDISPDGSWALLELLAPRESNYEMAEISALYLTNMNTSDAWLASDSGYIYADRYVWLSGGRFLWVDQEMVFAADLDGSNREDLQAPESIWQVWQGKAGTVLAQGESRMWLLDPVARTWAGMDVPSFSLTTVAHDGSYALSLGNAQDDDMDFALYRFNLDVEAQAEMLVQSKIIGGHGWPPRRPFQFGTGQYWSSGEGLSFDELSMGAFGIIDVEQGSVTHINRLMGLDEDVYTILSFSPDGRWINVREIETDDQTIFEIDAPGTQWAMQGEVLAWLEDIDTVLVFRTEEVEEGSHLVTKAILVNVNLRDGSSSVFLTDLAEDTREVLASGDRIFVREDISEINAYTSEGYLLGTLTFAQGVFPSIETLGDRSLVISFEATARDDPSGELCRKRALWIWQP